MLAQGKPPLRTTNMRLPEYVELILFGMFVSVILVNPAFGRSGAPSAEGSRGPAQEDAAVKAARNLMSVAGCGVALKFQSKSLGDFNWLALGE